MTNRRNKALLLAGFCASLLSTSALAATRVPGTYTYYSVIKDPITDLNKSMVSIDEVNDTAGLTALTVRGSLDHAQFQEHAAQRGRRLRRELARPDSSARSGRPSGAAQQ